VGAVENVLADSTGGRDDLVPPASSGILEKLNVHALEFLVREWEWIETGRTQQEQGKGERV
jgi:hypothetical protein